MLNSNPKNKAGIYLVANSGETSLKLSAQNNFGCVYNWLEVKWRFLPNPLRRDNEAPQNLSTKWHLGYRIPE